MIKTLGDEQLLEETKHWVSKEREATLKVITYLEEIERRKLYLKHGYSSLFQFCIKYLKLSEGAASRRINAMRLTREVPVVKEKIRTGELSLSTASMTQSFLQHRKKETRKSYTPKQKENIVNLVSEKPAVEVKKKFAAVSPSFEKREVCRPLTATTTRLSFVANNELLEKLKKIKDIHAHSLKNTSLEAVVELMTDHVLAADKKKKMVQNRQRNASPTRSKSRSIAASKKAAVFQRDHSRCSFKNPVTGRRCEATRYLQIDHIRPVSLGGGNDLGNLRLLCGAHNRYVWQAR